jgi:hypothetical protein
LNSVADVFSIPAYKKSEQALVYKFPRNFTLFPFSSKNQTFFLYEAAHEKRVDNFLVTVTHKHPN